MKCKRCGRWVKGGQREGVCAPCYQRALAGYKARQDQVICRKCERPIIGYSNDGVCIQCDRPPSASKFCQKGYGIVPPKIVPEPTGAIPGTAEKILVLEERARKGEYLFHDDDATLIGLESP